MEAIVNNKGLHMDRMTACHMGTIQDVTAKKHPACRPIHIHPLNIPCLQPPFPRVSHLPYGQCCSSPAVSIHLGQDGSTDVNLVHKHRVCISIAVTIQSIQMTKYEVARKCNPAIVPGATVSLWLSLLLPMHRLGGSIGVPEHAYMAAAAAAVCHEKPTQPPEL
jgi:hypothetical protein